jgi:hypothetical protein
MYTLMHLGDDGPARTYSESRSRVNSLYDMAKRAKRPKRTKPRSTVPPKPQMPLVEYPPEVLEWFRVTGALGGHARAQRLSAAERRASAVKAGRASGLARAKKARERQTPDPS